MVNISFCLLVVAMGINLFFFYRFLRKLKQSGLGGEKDIEGLSQLIISGSGGVHVQLRALTYLASRRYSSLGNKSVVKAGDHSRMSFFLTLGLLIIWALLTIFSQP